MMEEMAATRPLLLHRTTLNQHFSFHIDLFYYNIT